MKTKTKNPTNTKKTPQTPQQNKAKQTKKPKQKYVKQPHPFLHKEISVVNVLQYLARFYYKMQ